VENDKNYALTSECDFRETTAENKETLLKRQVTSQSVGWGNRVYVNGITHTPNAQTSFGRIPENATETKILLSTCIYDLTPAKNSIENYFLLRQTLFHQ